MKVKVNKIIQNIYGEPMKSTRKKPGAMVDENDIESVKKGREDMTLREVIVTALVSPLPDEKLDISEQMKRYKLVTKIQATKIEIELKSDEVVLIKDLISKTWPSPLISGQAFEMIEP